MAIAINDIKPNNLVFLTAEEAALIDGGDGWWDLPGQIVDGVKGGIATGAGAYSGSYLTSGGDVFKSAKIGAAGFVNGFNDPIPATDPWKAAGNFSKGFAGGVIGGYSGNHDSF